MKNKKVLVFGSNGMLGKYLCKLLKERDYDVFKNDVSNGGIDITDQGLVNQTIKDTGADVVVNAAAYTNVELAEDEKELAFKVNSDAPGYMANACSQLNIPFIHVSTDYVFGQNKEEGYEEDSKEFNPLNVYGESKLSGEKGVIEAEGNYFIFRTSWLFGPNATNFIDKITKYAKELPELKVVTDEVGCPTYVKDLSEAIILAIEGKIEIGIYHICSSDSLSRYDFAKAILELQNIETPIKPCILKDFPRKAKIPNISILRNTKLAQMRTSREMLKDYFSL